MASNDRLDLLDPTLKSRVEPFIKELEKNIPQVLDSVYLCGPSARGEFDPASPEIHLLLVFKHIDSPLLDHISALGRKFGKTGIRAPLILTSEYIANAADSFPIELLELRAAHITIIGEDRLAGLSVNNKDLRLQCERDLRSWRLHMRQAYLRSAGDAAWMSEWFLNSITDVFPLLRAVLHLLGGDPDCGNTETAARLSSLSGIDLAAFSEAWKLHKAGKRFDRKDVFAQFDRWEKALGGLVGKIDALEVR